MKIFRKTVIVILTILIAINFNAMDVFANDNTLDSNTITFIRDVEYTRLRNVGTKFFMLHIKIFSVDLSNKKFTGEFFVNGAYEYHQEITGDISTDIFWNSKEDGYSHSFTFYVNWKYGPTDRKYMYNLELNDKLGLLRGYTNTEDTISAQLGGCEFKGGDEAKNAFGIALKLKNISFDENLYDECLQHSVAVYGKFFWGKDVPFDLFKSLSEYNYTDIEGNNFKDNKDDNVSYAIAHKETEKGQQCMVVIRGTDGVEWEGNMKICPPDSNGNYDKYTFTDGDDTHDNFLNAALDLKDTIKEYLDIFEINNEDTTIVITGHSRGGAVSNLTAKELTDDIEVLSKVTAYTFATPNVAPFEKYPYMERYTNIYNFCKNKDFIPYIPLVNHSWDYWKYGITYIEESDDDEVYCNDITDIIADDDCAPSLLNYYNTYFFNESKSEYLNLYLFMQKALGKPMSEGKPLEVASNLGEIMKQYKGLSNLAKEMAKNIIYIWFNHRQDAYGKLSYDDYIPFTYTDALSRCKVGGLETNSVNQFGVISLSNEPPVEETPLQSVVEISRLSQFANNTDSDGVTNAEKLGWDLEDTSTWTGVEFDENGNVLSVDLHFKDLYGALNLADFTSLTNVDVSANYINSINVSNSTSLISLDVSDNELTELNTSGLTLLEKLNCGCNDIETLNLSDNTALVTLECSDCLLTSLDVSALTDLTTLNCSFNKLSALDITNNSNLTELYCMLNYLDLTDTNLVNSFSNINEAVYEPQYLPLNAQLDSDEINALKSFAQIGDNNSVLNFIDENGNIDLAEIQCYVQFEKVDGVYRASVIDISNEDLTGSLDLSSFDCLKELYCNDTSITSLNLSNCDNLEKLYCENSDISSLTLPIVSSTENSKLSELSCQNNKIDINIFTDDIVSNIKSKADYVLSYRHQIIDEPVSSFDTDDYNILVDFANQSNNQDLLNWDLTTPGNWNEVNWIKNAETGKYMLLDCYFDCLDVSGNLDLTSCDAMETISISGSNISTISLPPMDVDDYAFYDCKKLEAVILTGGSSIGESAFKFCPVLQGVYIPDSINSISQTAFEGLQNVTVAGNSNSYAESYCSSNGIPFEPGYFICGNIVTKENNSVTYEYCYPVEDVSVSGTTAVTDQYGYFVIFGLSEGEYSYSLNYDYGYDLSLDAVIDNSPAIITTPIGMVSFDWNNDGYINAKDYSMLIRQINGENTGIDAKYYDINKDGIVNRDDWIFAQKFFLTADIEEIQDSYEGIRYAYMPSAASATFGENLHIGIEELEGEDD